jgi:hypothetical protein
MDRALDLGPYLGGIAELTALVAALAFAAARLRGWLLPGWTGSPARLAESVLGLALLLLIAELLGAFGAFQEAPFVGASVAVGIAAGVLAGRLAATSGRPAQSLPAPSAGGVALAVAVGASAICFAGWADHAWASLNHGMQGTDTLWYHMPFSARWVQTGSVWDLHFTDPLFLNWFYPSNSELVHAIPLLATGRDYVSPLINFGFLAMALLAAWCIGRPYGLGPHALTGAAIVLGSGMTLAFQPGEARNDAAGIAFFLAAAALLINASAAGSAGPPWPGSSTGRETGGRAWRLTRAIGGPALIVAGLAAGLAIGTKLTLIAPVAALTAGVVAIAPAGHRARTAWIWIAAMVVGSGFWYLRNLVHAGNPFPWVDSIGPISLPAPDQALQLREHFAVVHYATDFGVWRDWFFPGLHESFGLLWPALLALAVAGAVLVIVRARTPLLRMLAGVAAFGMVAYVFTPLTASGNEGAPVGFVWNLRYLAPPIALALALLPLAPALERPRWRNATLAALAVAVIAADDALGRLTAGAPVWIAAGAALALAWVALLWLLHREISRAALIAGVTALAVAIAAAGFAEQRRYLDHRYLNVVGFFHAREAIAWAQDLRDSRVAVGGRRGVFYQYGFYGPDASNWVQWVGREGPHGAYLPIRSCEAWRRAVDDGDYSYVVTTPDLIGQTFSRTGSWTRGDPAAKRLISDGPVSVFRLRGRLDPAGCPRRH